MKYLMILFLLSGCCYGRKPMDMIVLPLTDPLAGWTNVHENVWYDGCKYWIKTEKEWVVTNISCFDFMKEMISQ